MIVATIQMKRKTSVVRPIDLARNQNFSVPMESVFPVSGAAIMMMTVVITRMNLTALDSSVKMVPSSAQVDTVSRLTSVVMATVIAAI